MIPAFKFPPADVGRPLWASYNRVVNSESFNNEDPGKINADGFAVKMRVGRVTGWRAVTHIDNIDDGFDLFNKIEDGANGVVMTRTQLPAIISATALSSVGKGSRSPTRSG